MRSGSASPSDASEPIYTVSLLMPGHRINRPRPRLRIRPRASAWSCADGIGPRRCDRPRFGVDQPPRPFGVLARAFAGTVECLRHQLDAGEPWQLADLVVEVDELLLALLVIEQVKGERVDLLLRLDALADWNPYAVQHPPVHSLGFLVAREPLLGGVEVEGEVTPLVFDDAAEQVLEHRVPRLAGQSAVAGQ